MKVFHKDRVAVVLERDGRFLVLRRTGKSSAGFEIGKGRWEFPAGAIEDGEEMETAAKREVTEECGLTVGSIRYMGMYLRTGVGKRPNTGRNVHFFHSDDFNGEISLSEEHDRYEWMTRDEILNLKGRSSSVDSNEFFNRFHN